MRTLKRIYRLVRAAGAARILDLASSLPAQSEDTTNRKAEGGNPCRGSAATGDLPPLPCLNSNNCTTDDPLQSNHHKAAFALKENIRLMGERHGVEKLGFLTTTFADQVHDIKIAQQRFHSLRTHVLVRYLEWIAVVERQKSGAVHFHVVVVVSEDIKTGFRFDVHKAARKFWNRWKRSDGKDLDSLAVHKALTRIYSDSATERLRAEWSFWRRMAPRFQFGRCELAPVRSNIQGISWYLSKYVSKHIGQRQPEDKGIRLARYSGFKKDFAGQVVILPANRVCCRFSWASPGATLYRWKLRALGEAFGCNGDSYQERFHRWFGPSWAHHLKDVIASIRLPVYPSLKALVLDYPHLEAEAGAEEAEKAISSRPGFEEEARQSLRVAWLVAEQLRSRRQHDPGEGRVRAAVESVPESPHVEPDEPCNQECAFVPQRRIRRSWMDYSAKDD